MSNVAERRIKAFASLGRTMCNAAEGDTAGPAYRFAQLIETLHSSNPWFTPENVRRALKALGEKLTEPLLSLWLEKYPCFDDNGNKPLTAGVVMAGNIPLAGFHDLLCILITGNRLKARVSSKDNLLVMAVAETLREADPLFCNMIEITYETLTGFDMVIATGSNNTSRYFEYYFRSYPSIIRGNRNSVAVIEGNESTQELSALADDVFSYFGLGCRNVSKLYLPEGYDLNKLLNCWSHYEHLRSHNIYAVNYDHNKAVMIVNREQFIDTGFVLLRENHSLTPPMAVVFYQYYPSAEWLESELSARQNQIQCIAGHGRVPFGRTQNPELWDYADNIDTISFLLKINCLR